MKNSKNIIENKIPEFQNVLNSVKELIKEIDAEVETKEVVVPDDFNAVSPYDYTGFSQLNKPRKTYYNYFKNYKKTYINFVMSPVHFVALINQLIFIDFKLNVKLPSSTKNYVAKIYLNNSVVKTYNIGSLAEETEFTFEYCVQHYNLEPGNIIYVKINELENNIIYTPTVYVENLKMQLYGTNVYVLHFEKKFNVTCFNNTYYITKSTGEKTYLMEKNIDEITNINEEDFVEIPNAYGSSAQIIFSSKQKDNEFVFDKKILTTLGPNGEMKIINLTDNTTVVSDILGSNFRVAECLPHKNSNEFVFELNAINAMWSNYSSQWIYFRFSSALNYATATEVNINLQPGWFLPVLSPNGNINLYTKSIYAYAGLPLIGASLCDLTNEFISFCGVINGVQATAYYLDNVNTKIELFANVFGKCVRSVAQEISSNVWQVTERKVIGNYDYYFQGANNDYFVVVNDKLKYYKKS